MSKVIYIASFEHGEPNLASVEVAKETNRQFQVDRKSVVNIIGWQHISSRVRKTNNIFDNEVTALRWLEAVAIEYVRQTIKQLEEARLIVSNIRMRLEE